MEVDVTSIWDGKDTQTRKIADISLRLAEIDIPIGRLDPFRNLKFLEDVDNELQPLADIRFGRGTTIVQGAEVKAGSLEIILWLMAAGTMAYKFFKDYESLRKGIVLFAKDVEAANNKIETLIKKHYIEKKKRKSSLEDYGKEQGRTR